jgi:hypothetical protein
VFSNAGMTWGRNDMHASGTQDPQLMGKLSSWEMGNAASPTREYELTDVARHSYRLSEI